MEEIKNKPLRNLKIREERRKVHEWHVPKDSEGSIAKKKHKLALYAANKKCQMTKDTNPFKLAIW